MGVAWLQQTTRAFMGLGRDWVNGIKAERTSLKVSMNDQSIPKPIPQISSHLMCSTHTCHVHSAHLPHSISRLFGSYGVDGGWAAEGAVAGAVRGLLVLLHKSMTLSPSPRLPWV